MEIWKEIANSKYYAISSYGRVKRLERKQWCKVNNSFSTYKEKILVPNSNNSKKYLRIKIMYNDYSRTEQLHRLVAKEFIPNPNNLPQVNHKDGNKMNNHYTNLEWVTGSQNMRHRIDILGIKSWKTGNDCNFGKLTEEQVKQLPELLKTKTRRAVAKMFNVSSTTITEITSGRSWRHLNLKFPKAFYHKKTKI